MGKIIERFEFHDLGVAQRLFFDAANKAALLARLQELIAAGVIHQAVMVDVDGAAYEAAARNGGGVSIIRV